MSKILNIVCQTKGQNVKPVLLCVDTMSLNARGLDKKGHKFPKYFDNFLFFFPSKH